MCLRTCDDSTPLGPRKASRHDWNGTTTLMRIVCAWCGSTLREDADSNSPVSHGICDECSYTFLNERGIGLRRLLDATKIPVVVVNGDREIQHDDRTATRQIGRVIGCANAKCCGGCGGSASCDPCNLRKAITHTHADGKPRYGIVSEHPLGQKGACVLSVHFSTTRVDANVFVIFERRALLPHQTKT